MLSSTLDSLLQARSKGRPFVLIRWIDAHREQLVFSDDDLDGDLQDAVRDALRRDRSSLVTVNDEAIFLQVFNPSLRMIIVGAVHIAQALVPFAQLSGYEVSVIDPRRAFAADERFPGTKIFARWPEDVLPDMAPDSRTAVVTLTHDPKIDDPALHSALSTEAFYIGSLGSKRTHASRLERLSAAGFDDATLARIQGPVGLDIGAVSPAEIAVAIMAQVTQTLRQRPHATKLP